MAQNTPKILMKKIISLCLAILTCSAVAALTPAGLRCDYAADPLGVDSPAPRLFWKLPEGGREARQSAYQILAASSEKNLAQDNGDLWDSGKIVSDETIQIPYSGKNLVSAQQVFWKIRTWDAADAWGTEDGVRAGG